MSRPIFLQSQEVNEFLKEIHSLFLNTQQTPDRVILDDVDLRNMLKVEKRTTGYLRSRRMIIFSKIGGKFFYTLENVLDFIHRHQVDCIADNVITTQKSVKRTRRK